MPPTTHRAYAPGDRDACVSVFRSNIPRFFREQELQDFTRFLDSGDCPYFVLLIGGRIVGCGGFGIREGSEIADLCWGMVHAAHHGDRLGEYLILLRLHAVATTTNCTAVRLGTSQHTDGFFQHYGFTVESIEPDGLAAGLDDVEMRLELTEPTRQRIVARWLECG